LLVALFGSAGPGRAQIEPEVFTASTSFNKALSSNPPDVSEAVSILVGYDGLLERRVLQSKWVNFLADKAPGKMEEQRKRLAELFDAFDGCFDTGESAKQCAKSFIELQDEVLGRTTPKREIERSASVFLERLRKLPEAQRSLLKEFGRQAKLNIPDPDK
jgi:hypothetical protein